MVHKSNNSDASNPATCVEDFRNDVWPAMFEHTSQEDINWLHDVANLLEQHARSRANAPVPRKDSSTTN